MLSTEFAYATGCAADAGCLGIPSSDMCVVICLVM